jgi:hypothetical protein
MTYHRSNMRVLGLAVFGLSLALLPVAALAESDQLAVAQEAFGGAIDVQPGSIVGHVMLGSDNAALQATLGDTGLDAQLNLVVPGQFVGETTVGNGMLTYQLQVCGPGVTVTFSKTQSVAAHFGFQDAAADPARCTAVPAAAQALVMGAFEPAAAQATPATSDNGVQAGLADWFRRLVGYTLVGAVLLLFAPAMPRVVDTATRTSPWGRVGLGLVLLFTVPLIGVLAFALLLPIGLWWLGLLVLAMFPVLLILSLSVSGMALGTFALARMNQPRVPLLVGLVAGTIVLTIASLLPYVGSLVTVAALIFGFGTLALAPRTPPTSALTPPQGGQATSSDPVDLVSPAPVIAA